MIAQSPPVLSSGLRLWLISKHIILVLSAFNNSFPLRLTGAPTEVASRQQVSGTYCAVVVDLEAPVFGGTDDPGVEVCL